MARRRDSPDWHRCWPRPDSAPARGEWWRGREVPEGDTMWRSAAPLREHRAGKSLKEVQPQTLQVLRGRSLEAVEPVGKHLLMRFSGGWTLHSHMRMTGSWHLYQEGMRWRRPRQFARAILEFGEWTAVCFSAPVLQVVRNEASAVGHLGPDILADEFPLDRVVARARAAGPLPLGELLLDQRICCGIGNVYKCESLWQRGLDPWKSSAGLGDRELGELFEAA